MKKTILLTALLFLIIISFGNSKNPQTNTTSLPVEIKYDIKIILVKIDVIKADEGWGGDASEDLFGSMTYKFRMDNTLVQNLPTLTIWRKNGNTYSEFSPESTSGISKATIAVPARLNLIKELATNITFAQLLLAETYLLESRILDKNPAKNGYYMCRECSGVPLKIKLSDYRTEIQNMKPGDVRNVSPNEFNYHTLNYYEDGDVNKSHVRFQFRIEVTAK